MVKKEENKIEKSEGSKKLIFAGASHLAGVDPKKLTQAEIVAHKARTLVAAALDIPANMVVIMGNQPYVDNHGRKYLLEKYAPEAQFEYEYIQIAKDDTEKAVVKCRIIERKELKPGDPESTTSMPLCGWVIGECSPSTTRMSTLKGYQNHLAQTRAENRAFEAAFGTKFRKDLYEGIGRELEKEPQGKDDQKIADVALTAGNTSAEEVIDAKGKEQKTGGTFDPFRNAEKSIEAAKDAKTLEGLRARVRGSKNFSPAQVNKLLGTIDEKIARL